MKIILGNFEDLKEEMKMFHDDVKKKIKSLENVRKEKKYLNEEDQQKLKELETLKYLYNPSKVLPVKIADLVVNYKVLTSFLKKIKKIPHDIDFEDEYLVVRYQVNSHAYGHLMLNDLSKYFRDFQNSPEGVLEGE